MPATKAHRILAITPSPALDLSGVVDRLRPNEKSYVHDETRAPGGNAINAARILTRLKIPVVTSGFLGGNIGQEIKSLLDDEKVKSKFVKIRGHSRICVTVSNRTDNKQTRLTFPGPHITRQEKEKLGRLIAAQRNVSLLVFGGSLPKGLKAQDVVRWIRLAKEQNIDCIVDCPGAVLRDLIVAQPTLIKPNLTEFHECTGSSVQSISQVKRTAERLLSQVPMVCVSSVEDGALLVTNVGTFFGRIPRVTLRSTVGAGDSMVGAMAAQLYKYNSSPGDILRWGLAAAAATLQRPGTAFGSARDIRSLYQKTTVIQI